LLVGNGETAQPVLFDGTNLAFSITGPDKGTNHESTREADKVWWMRLAGQTAVKENA
jgi:hypothetical protein